MTRMALAVNREAFFTYTKFSSPHVVYQKESSTSKNEELKEADCVARDHIFSFPSYSPF